MAPPTVRSSARVAASLTTSSASIASSDGDTGEQLRKEKRRGDDYQKELYGTRKKLKRSHNTSANQAAVLAETQLENTTLRAQVTHLEDEIMGLEAESSNLQAEPDGSPN
ncbi:hypothetical protein DFH07DRAFT_972797 [Mycena maculata]|uniref:Uncharacterized protein n=1 Tax=Mycena maculata TaxID=230809 RepID=A0AAD7MJ06_9AGAR|nr:hypothetical protein DFH07DRAFT_972797 [Mycena maculata]